MSNIPPKCVNCIHHKKTDRDRLIELIRQGKDMTPCEKNSEYNCKGVKCEDCESQSIADHLLSNGVIVPPCKVGDLPDRLFSHNSIIAIWVEIPKEHCSQRLWRGMAWDIPEKYKEMPFKWIFGSIPESIYEADTINVLVELTKKEAEQALKEHRNNG